MPAWVYILECSDGSYYAGSTSNLERRVAQHNEGAFPAAYTSRRRPVKLLWSQEFTDMADAIAAERQLKGWARAKKKALMAGDFDVLHELAKSTRTRKRESGGR